VPTPTAAPAEAPPSLAAEADPASYTSRLLAAK
jgi:hypothetical protein